MGCETFREVKQLARDRAESPLGDCIKPVLGLIYHEDEVIKLNADLMQSQPKDNENNKFRIKEFISRYVMFLLNKRKHDSEDRSSLFRVHKGALT